MAGVSGKARAPGGQRAPGADNPRGASDTAIAPARRCAYAVLRRVFERGAYADLALRAEAESARLDARDRALAMRLAYGAVQRKATLDHLIGRLAERPPARLDPPVLAALRLGLYELLYLSGSPDRAVVADAVELAKRHGARRPRPRQRGAAARRARRRRRCCSARSTTRTPEQAARDALPPRVDRAPVVGATRRRAKRARCWRRQRAGRGRAAREHARHRRRFARRGAGRAIGLDPSRRDARPRRSCSTVSLRRPRLAAVAGRALSSRSRARRCSSRARWARRRASACSTCARRRAARRPIWRR